MEFWYTKFSRIIPWGKQFRIFTWKKRMPKGTSQEDATKWAFQNKGKLVEVRKNDEITSTFSFLEVG